MFDELNSDALRFQELYYSERKHIAHLDQQRCGGFSDQGAILA
jgi:DNA primase